MEFKNHTPIETNNINLAYGGVVAQIDASYNSIVIYGNNQKLSVSIAQVFGEHADLAIDSMKTLFEIELDENETDAFYKHESVGYYFQLDGSAIILNIFDCFEWSKEFLCYPIDKGVNAVMEKILANESIY